MYRYNPALELEGKNPFILDSKEPTGNFQEFLKSENRYATLTRQFPDIAADLLQRAEADAKRRFEIYKRMAEM